MTELPKLAITMGDPAGVGPEICLQLLASPSDRRHCIPLVFGDAGVLHRVADELKLSLPYTVVSASEPDSWRELAHPAIVDFAAIDASVLEPGRVSAETGAAAYRYLTAAIDAALAGNVAGLTTAPISKEALHLAGLPYPGHTEILIERTGAERACMMLTSDLLTCSLVTTHVSLAEVPRLLSAARILEVIQLSAEAMGRLRGRASRMAVCGLNPHAGEQGLFGDEEQRHIVPAIARARELGHRVEGPLPADTAFLPARRASTDVYICMYHDQGLIPLKTLAFDTAVNMTLGLPIVRTSVDHGTATDIAWQGKARATSLMEAVRLAAKLAG